jgi:hypothetical protein
MGKILLDSTKQFDFYGRPPTCALAKFLYLYLYLMIYSGATKTMLLAGDSREQHLRTF